MSVDVASLVFEIDSTQAVVARENLAAMNAEGDKSGATSRKFRTATEQAGIGLKAQADASNMAVKSATELASSQGAVEKASRGAATASAAVRAQRALEAAAMRELVLATKAYEKDLADAAKAGAVEAKAEAAARATAATEAAAAEAAAAKAAVKAAKDAAAEEAAASKARTAEIMADRALEAAAMRELVAATKAYEKDQAAAAAEAAAVQIAADREAAASAKATAKAEAEAAAEEIATARARSAALAEARALDAAAMREVVTATKQWDAEQAAAARAADALANKVDAVRGRIDPLAAVQIKAANATNTLNTALEKGVITEAEHAALSLQVAQAAEKGAEGLVHLGASSKLSGVQVAELSHIARSASDALAAGANPFRVLAMESGRLGQVLGSGGGLSGILGAIISPLGLAVIGFGALAAAVGVATFSMIKGEQEMSKFQGSLIATGNYAGLTADSLKTMSDGIAVASHTTETATRTTVEALAETGKFGTDSIGSLADAAQNYSKITGENASKFVKEYEGMGDHLVQFAVKHEDVYHDLTVQQIEQIALLVKHGQEQKAQDQLAADIDAASKTRLAAALIQQDAQISHYGLLMQAMHGVGEAAKSMWDQILNIGRPATAAEEITKAQQRVEGLNSQYNTHEGNTPAVQAARTAAEANLIELQRRSNASSAAASASAATAAKNHDAIQAKFGDGKAKGRTPTDNNATALDTAQKAQLAAEQALTQDVERVAEIKHLEVAAELKLQEDRVAKEVKEKTITSATAALADTAYKAAATAKDALIDRQKTAAIAAHSLQQDEALASDQDKLAAIQETYAKTAQDRNKLEEDTLARRQVLDQRSLALALENQVLAGTTTDRERLIQELSQIEVQQAQTKQKLRDDEIKVIEEAAALRSSELQRQGAVLQADASLLTSAYARAVAEKNILAITQQEELIQAQRAIDVTTLGSAARTEAENAMAGVKARQAADKKLLDRQTDLVHGIQDATSAAGSLKEALARHDWGSVFDEFERTIEAVQASFAAHGLSGGLTAGGSAIASLVGGPTGTAIGTGLGIAGLGASLGVAAGAYATSAAGAAFVAGAAGANAVGISLLGSFAGTIAPLLGPIGIIAGIGVALASLLKSKPSNNAAISTFNGTTGFATGGDKATSDTTSAATQASNAVLQGEQLLQAAGIKLATTVSKIDIGTRDLTHVFLSTGEEVRSAIGDPAAAAEAGLKAVLQGATYTSDAEKSLVDSLLAAGDGFDTIATALQNYAAAQQISASIQDQINQISDPQAYDTSQVKAAIDAQKASAQAMATAGDLTATQLATINGQLDTLEGLQIDAVVKKYADTLNAAQQAAADSLSAANDNVGAARGAASDAYDAETSAIQANIDALNASITALTAFSASLTSGDLASLSPSQQLAATRSQFDSLNALPAADPNRLAGLQSAGEAFLAASKAAAPTQAAYNRDLAAVRLATDSSVKAAGQQVSLDQQQLDADKQMVAGLGVINDSITSGTATLASTISGLMAAIQAQKVAQATVDAQTTPATAPSAGAANDNVDYAQYLADNPDLLANYNSGGSLSQIGATSAVDAARLHYLTTGAAEIAAGTRKFATGGSMTVHGPATGDQVPVNFMANGGEQVSISKADSMAEVADELKSLRLEVASLRAAAESTARSTASMDTRGGKQDIRGLYVRGEQPGDPVSTQELAA